MIRRDGSVRRSPRRYGSTYVLILMVSMLLVVIGLGGLTVHRVSSRVTSVRQDWHEAGVLAQSATEEALEKINADVWWRQVYAANEAVYTPELPFGRGQLSWRLDDLVDDDLVDSDADPIRLYGRARVGKATRVYSVMAWPSGQSLDVLRSAIHVTGNLTINGGLDVRSGPASSNSSMYVAGGQVLGDVEAAVVDVPANVQGGVLTPSPPKQAPAAAIWGAYRSFATEIKYTELGNGRLEDTIVSPERHPTRPDDRNADGLYRIKVPSSSSLKIRRCRIEGTLLIELDLNSSFRIEGDILWKPHRPDFPALIVYTRKDSGTTVEITCDGELSEPVLGINLNPPDTPYYGASDEDTADTYSASIRGVVHVIRDVVNPSSMTTIDAPRKITGCVIVDGRARTQPGSKISADPTLLSRPPLGYTTVPDRDNSLTNGDIEAGLTGWSAASAGTALVEWREGGDAHDGNGCLRIKDRVAAWAGVAQDVTSKLVSGETYASEVWLEMSDEPEGVKTAMEINSTVEGAERFETTVPAIGKSWTRVQTQHTPTWTGTLVSAYWVVETTSTDQEFLLDDAVLAPVGGGNATALMLPVPGTWRREVAE